MSKTRKFDRDGFRNKSKTSRHERNKKIARIEDHKSKTRRNEPKEDDWT